MRYQLRDKEPTNVREAQDKAIKIDKNIQDSGKSNVLGFSKEVKKVQDYLDWRDNHPFWSRCNLGSISLVACPSTVHPGYISHRQLQGW